VTIPGVAIFVTVLSMSLIGDGLTDAFNPKLRER
jgi:peptide/nickel transport system permease protein